VLPFNKRDINFVKYILFLLLFSSISAFAQNDNTSAGVQVGAFIGNTLPSGIEGADDIFPLWGLRYSHGLSRRGFADISTFFGNSEGVSWQGAALGISMQAPIETLVGHAGIGLDYTRYETTTTAVKNYFGGHFIGGVMAEIGGNTFARFDMKLNSKPGSSLYFAIGLVFML